MGIPWVGECLVQDGLVDVALLPRNQSGKQAGDSMEGADLTDRSRADRRFQVTDARAKDLFQALVGAQEWTGAANHAVCSEHPLLDF
jgi:hypothetical protein